MKKFLLVLCLLVFSVPESHARVGGGRSFGSRGSRAVAPRSPSSPHTQPGYTNRSAPSAAPHAPASPMGFGAPSMMRSIAGGLVGGMLGSMLFRSMGWAGQSGMPAGQSGFGFLEILLLAGIAFLVFRWVRNRRGVVSPQPQFVAAVANDSIEQVIGSDVDAFKEARTDDFFLLQAALANRELGKVRDRLTPQMAAVLETDVASLKSKGQINRIENITVRESEVVEAWQDSDCDYATLRLKANLLDFTVDEKTGTLLGGSQDTPVKFDEFWTFARDRHSGGQGWKLSAIENQA